ncbi:MAG: hypothetical protein ACP5XB_06410 [Isosphaeraceae bacterium]
MTRATDEVMSKQKAIPGNHRKTLGYQPKIEQDQTASDKSAAGQASEIREFAGSYRPTKRSPISLPE